MSGRKIQYNLYGITVAFNPIYNRIWDLHLVDNTFGYSLAHKTVAELVMDALQEFYNRNEMTNTYFHEHLHNGNNYIIVHSPFHYDGIYLTGNYLKDREFFNTHNTVKRMARFNIKIWGKHASLKCFHIYVNKQCNTIKGISYVEHTNFGF